MGPYESAFSDLRSPLSPLIFYYSSSRLLPTGHCTVPTKTLLQNQKKVSSAKVYLGWRRDSLLLQREVKTSSEGMLQTEPVTTILCTHAYLLTLSTIVIFITTLWLSTYDTNDRVSMTVSIDALKLFVQSI